MASLETRLARRFGLGTYHAATEAGVHRLRDEPATQLSSPALSSPMAADDVTLVKAPAPFSLRTYIASLFKEHSSVTFAFLFLVAVGVSKTLLTKLVFTHSPTPVAFSVLSCIATNICLTPILIYQGDVKPLTREMLPGFCGICLAIAVDLACQNVALAILSIALQQCLKATSPTFTVIVESIVRRKKQHTAIYATVTAICIGPILVAMASSWKARSEAGSQAFGATMMVVAMVGGAFKNVLCHKAIKELREVMGVLAFTFWVEVFVALMLAPWALLNGEAAKLAYDPDRTASELVLLWATAAFGGVRVISQFYFLAKTSATSLAMSGIAMQALTILIGIIAFQTHVTALLALGVLCTIVISSIYMGLKTSSVLEKKPIGAPITLPKENLRAKQTAKATEMSEARMGLREADSALDKESA